MPASEALYGWRVVADPTALDTLSWSSASPDSIVLRLAPDDALVLGATAVHVDDPHAIVEPDSGWRGWRYSETAFAAHVAHHVEWTLPGERPALAQGLVAGVPVKLWFAGDGTVLVVCAAAYAAELTDRIGAA